METTNPLTLEDFVRFARPRPLSFLLLSISLEIFYWPFFLVVIVYVTLESLSNPLILLYPRTILLYALVALCGRLRKRFRINTVKRLKNERRSPILYLRSFYLESFEESRSESLKFYEKEHDDEVLAVALKGVGPLIAVGRPSDKIPPLGALRLYFNDQEWQEQVSKLMAISQLIILQPGYTDGTEWEMLAVKNLPPEKIIYSFLAWQHLDKTSWLSEYGTFADQFKRIYKCDLPGTLRDNQFLYFDKEWRSRLTRLSTLKSCFFWISSSPHLVWRLWSLLLSFKIVAPVFKRLPIPKLLRKYSVSCVRESLRPIFNERSVYLPVWRTVAFVIAVTIGAGWLFSILIINYLFMFK